MDRLRAVFLASALLFSVAVLTQPVAYGATIYHQATPRQGMDRWFGSYYNQNAQYDWHLRVGGWGDEYDTVLRFDHSNLPQVAVKAIVWLYVFPEGTGFTSIDWFEISSQWQSETISWSNQPSSVYLGYTNAPTKEGWYGVDFTYIYNNYWRKGMPSAPSTLNYGLLMRPRPRPGGNRYTSAYSSNNPVDYPRPILQVDYTPLSDDYKLKLRWPLGTAYSSRVVTTNFGDLSPLTCDDGFTQKVHNGTDYRAAENVAVYAVDDGIVKEIREGGVWKKAIIIEHTHLTRGKYTSVSWHVNPLVAMGDFVPKGMKIATIAYIAQNTHFHFGVRLGAYANPQSSAGALPPAGNPACDKRYQTFPGGFINPEDSSIVLFQP